MSQVNECGVIETTDTVVLINKGQRSVAIIRLAEHEGRWHWGIDMYYGGTRAGAEGISWAPSVKRHIASTKAAAISAAKKWMKDRALKSIELYPEMRPFLQPIVDACGPQQRSLFEVAS